MLWFIFSDCLIFLPNYVIKVHGFYQNISVDVSGQQELDEVLAFLSLFQHGEDSLFGDSEIFVAAYLASPLKLFGDVSLDLMLPLDLIFDRPLPTLLIPFERQFDFVAQ